MQDRFSQTLKGLLDDTGKLTRKEWADHLITNTEVLNSWVDGSSIPSVDVLLKIYSYLRRFSDPKVQDALKNFYEIADLPIKEVVQESNLDRFNASTVADYVTAHIFPANLRYDFSQTPLKYRLAIISTCKLLIHEANALIADKTNPPDILEVKNFEIGQSAIRMLFVKEAPAQ